jgi:Zn-finger nucleic acid-binding protein
MRLSDDQWLARARSSAADGEYEPVSPVLVSDGPSPAVPGVPCCAFCVGRPPLEVYPRREVVSSQPLYYCPRCYGFWALAGTLDHGVRDAYDDHPAFVAALPPPRCRSCFGHLKPNGACAKCGAVRVAPCPGCGEPMTTYEEKGLRLDQCAKCQGTWFDMGELARVYGLQPIQGFAASLVDEHACDDEPPGWQLFIESALGLFLRFAP